MRLDFKNGQRDVKFEFGTTREAGQHRQEDTLAVSHWLLSACWLGWCCLPFASNIAGDPSPTAGEVVGWCPPQK